jgi:nicotinate-nucleotide pyrophosphorylase (carboxylating)
MVERSELSDLVARALAEDLGDGDITSDAVVPEDARARARLVQKEAGVIYGLEAAAEAFAQCGAEGFEPLAAEGAWRAEFPADVATVEGPGRALLAAERTALNLLGHLSGVATLTARFVGELADTNASVLDTRKTIAGMRALEKAAVAAAGGRNHRMGLYDAVLIKENHAALVGGVGEAVRRAKAALPDQEVEVECRDLAELEEALEAGAEWILLDNMDREEIREAVTAAERAAGDGARACLEASGGITLDNATAIAATGVDFISVGALTHSAPALDLSMVVEPE